MSDDNRTPSFLDPYDAKNAFERISLLLVRGAEDTRQRRRFKEKNPDAAKWFEESEEKVQKLHRYFVVATTSGDKREASEAAAWIAQNVESIVFHWYVGRKAYQDFVARDCPPMKFIVEKAVEALVDGHVRVLPEDDE